MVRTLKARLPCLTRTCGQKLGSYDPIYEASVVKYLLLYFHAVFFFFFVTGGN